jgi:hypothetical protein
MGGGQPQPVGDVVPFIKKGLGPNPMNLSEGAGRVQAGGSGRTPQYPRPESREEARLQEQMRTLKITDRDKYEAALLRQAIEDALRGGDF